MKQAIIIVALISLTGCGSASRMGANISGTSKSCIGGVTYLQFPSGVAVQVDRTGKPVACP